MSTDQGSARHLTLDGAGRGECTRCTWWTRQESEAHVLFFFDRHDCSIYPRRDG